MAFVAPLSSSSFLANSSQVTSRARRNTYISNARTSPALGTARMTVAYEKGSESLDDPIDKAAKDNSFKNLNPSVGEKRLNIGIIGAGRIGQVHAENITFRLRNANLVGISSGSRELAERCSLEHGCQPFFEYQEMCEDPEIDAVCICSASNKHSEQIIAAARAGKHIFCEKPIDTDLRVIDEALAEVRKAGVKLQVGFNRRFDQNYRRVRQSILSGEIGQPHMLHIISRDPSPPTLDYIKNSGGIWLDCAIHDMDMCRFLIGDEVEEVYTLGAVNILPEMAQYGDVDTSIISLKFKNGVIGTIDNSRRAVYGYDQRCEILGSKGSIQINNNYQNSAVISTASEVKRDLPMNFWKSISPCPPPSAAGTETNSTRLVPLTYTYYVYDLRSPPPPLPLALFCYVPCTTASSFLNGIILSCKFYSTHSSITLIIKN